MGTVPTGEMERELRKLYLRWVSGLTIDSSDLPGKITTFQAQSEALIARLGGRTAALGALGDFPAPRLLELSPHAGTVYNQMQQAVIQAGIMAGISSKEAAQAIFRAGMDKSYRRLERLARTETTSAYWKNSWDSIADLPALVMVWSSERGPRTCQWCDARDGLVVDDPNIRDHPNGRCTLIPTLRSQVKYKGTLQPDGSVTMDPRWSDQKVKGAKAQESAGPTTEAQRDPLSGKGNPAAPSQAEPAQRVATQAPAPQPTPAVRTFGQDVTPKVRKERLAAGDWRYVDDRGQRAAVLLQNDYRAEQAIKKMAKAMREGADTRVAIPKAWSKEFTGSVTDVAGARYTEQQVRDALEDAARWLLEQDTKAPRVMFKGLDVPKDKIAKLFKEGGTFDTNFSSFTTDEVIARGYSSRRATQQVIVRVKGAPAVPINGNPTADFWKKTKEHLVTGQGRITGVTEAHGGRTVYVDVAF
ncbi:MuF-like minor capsid protein [Microbacterium phage WilliamStrong]|nr:MuF-like minor capsid protein [Microbacterium phage WilliamStrong]